MREVRSQRQTKRITPQNKLWSHSYLITAMVREVAVRWSPTCTSILAIYQKLKDLGFTHDGEQMKRATSKILQP